MARIRVMAMLVALAGVSACGGSDGITVSGGKLTSLRFGNVPTSVKVGETFSVTVELLNEKGNRIPTGNDIVTLTLVGSGALTGTTTAAAVGGLASFSGLGVTTAAASLQLKATAGTVTGNSSTFAATDPCVPVALSFPGTVQGSMSSSGCTLNGNASAVYRFTTSTTSGVQASITSSFGTPALEVTTDPVGNNVSWRAVNANGSLTADWLLPAGTFLVRPGARNGGTGTFTLSLTSASLTNTSCTDRTLVTTITLSTQAIANTDCPYGDGTFYDSFIILSLKPCVITMSSNTLDSFLEVVDATAPGIVVASNDDAPGAGLNSRLDLTSGCNASGNPIQIRANTSALGTGSYSLTVTITGGGSIRLGGPAPAAPNTVTKKLAAR